jgi:tRNA (cmo5U34)-methyltransferase
VKIPSEWTFLNKDVAEGFDKHVREQLPWYDLATAAVVHIARHYIPKGGLVYDIGASTGNIGRSLRDIIDDRQAEFIPIDQSREMCDKYEGPGTILCTDALEYDFKPFDLGIAFLVLMFIPPSKRGELIARLRSNILPGGALIVFDKLIPSSGYTASILWRMTLAGKLASGAKPEEIIAKELSLSGVQRPLSPSEIYPGIEVFRFGDFGGWIIEAETKQPV